MLENPIMLQQKDGEEKEKVSECGQIRNKLILLSLLSHSTLFSTLNIIHPNK